MVEDWNLALIAGDFLNWEIPPGKEWLSYYFDKHSGTTTSYRGEFLSYYLIFRDLAYENPIFFYMCFTDHTGIDCTRRAMVIWRQRCEALLAMANEASRNFDLELLQRIKTGQSTEPEITSYIRKNIAPRLKDK